MKRFPFYIIKVVIDSWRVTHNTDMNFHTRTVVDKIKADIMALSKVESMMAPDQKVLCRGAIRKIIELMKNMGQSEKAGEIQDVSISFL